MRIVFLFLILLCTAKLKSQVLCGTAGEGGTVTITAPPGNVFITVEFASYGTPNGSCGSFTFGSCHSNSSGTVCYNAFVGRSTATVGANNGVFGDPCVGTVKRLYVQVRYDALVPLNLLSFTARKLSDNQVRLDWSSEEEVNSSHFIVERSSDGKSFEDVGIVIADGAGSGKYSFTTDMSSPTGIHFFRLKIIDRDKKIKFSNVVRINSGLSLTKLSLYPNPADHFVTVTNNKPNEAVITNVHGIILKKTMLVNGTQTIDVSGFRTGVYFIKTSDAALRFVKR
ncbi:MAG: T9SS type A sorting domain-containing protein [Chitinophagaceae bacterium]|nr:T9SS type A sorting domain-containing protein [Chitinophagaceae bacterium]